ncbi:hypothetical protein M9458_000972, partial [Cirrhinus mrigala]
SWCCAEPHIGPQRKLTSVASAGGTSSSCPSSTYETTVSVCSVRSSSTLALKCSSPSRDSY